LRTQRSAAIAFLVTGEPFQGYGGIIAIRDEDWKAIRQGVNKKNKKNVGPWELFNIADDPGEQKNLASEHPDIVLRLEQDFVSARTVEPDFPTPLYDNAGKTK